MKRYEVEMEAVRVVEVDAADWQDARDIAEAENYEFKAINIVIMNED